MIICQHKDHEKYVLQEKQDNYVVHRSEIFAAVESYHKLYYYFIRFHLR